MAHRGEKFAGIKSAEDAAECVLTGDTIVQLDVASESLDLGITETFHNGPAIGPQIVAACGMKKISSSLELPTKS